MEVGKYVHVYQANTFGCTLVSLTSDTVRTPRVLLAYAILYCYIIIHACYNYIEVIHAILMPHHLCTGHGRGMGNAPCGLVRMLIQAVNDLYFIHQN